MGKKVQFRGRIIYILLYWGARIIHWLYYRKITVVGLEKIPANTPVIFAPNHQNALMDAFAVLFASGKQAVFLARADIFKKPSIARILNMMRILPIYRLRDGMESLGRNQEVFDSTVQVLKSNIPLCILPEGNHEGKKFLRPLKKGIFRIAFQAEESMDFNLNLHIIPIGIDYSDYFNPGSDLTVVFGNPIKVADYRAEYRQNEQKTIHDLMEVLAENMRQVMLHIPEEYYSLIKQTSEIYEPYVWNTTNTKRHPFNKLTIKQYIIQKATDVFARFPEKAAELKQSLSRYLNLLKHADLNDIDLQKKAPLGLPVLLELLITLLLLPVHLFGTILNYFPYKIPSLLVSRIKDEHFKSSVTFGIYMFLFPIYYLIIIWLFCLLTDGSFSTLAFAISLPLTGMFAFYNYKNMLLLKNKLRIFMLRHTNIKKYNALYNERDNLIELIKTIINS